MTSGVYQIAHSLSGKRYVGSARNFSERWRGHRSRLISGKHHNAKLQGAWNKYGPDAFTFSILLRCSPDRMLLHEQSALDVLKPEYNIALFAANPMLGRCQTESAKAKISLFQTGKARSPATRLKMSIAALGNLRGLGHRHSPEARKLMSLNHLGSRGRTGQPHSLETRKRLRDAWSPERRSAQSARCLAWWDLRLNKKLPS